MRVMWFKCPACLPKFDAGKNGKSDAYLPFGKSPFVMAPAQLSVVPHAGLQSYRHHTSQAWIASVIVL